MADPTVGKIVKVDGKVEVRDGKGVKREPGKVGKPLKQGDSLHAEKNGMAVVKTGTGDVVVLSRGSALRLKDNKGTYEHISGKALYSFKPSARNTRRVETVMAVAGIRGTTFLVEGDDKSTSIALKEGSLDVESKFEGFNVYRQKEMIDFETFKEEFRKDKERLQEEFRQYRAKVEEEFVAFKKSVQLESQQILSISGDKATIGKLDENANQYIRELEEFAAGQF
jgi:hypothetical protein